MLDNDLDSKKKSIKRKVRLAEKKSMIKNFKRIAIAASILLVMGLYFNRQYRTEALITPKSNIKIGADKATLTLEDGQKILLEKGKSFDKDYASSNGEHLIYDDVSDDGEIRYNSLKIPRGGEFFVQLADGTKVWLNSESELRYPVSFKIGEPRKVELVYGEAYLEVSSSTDNEGAPFLVMTGNQQIKVLGTEFNIEAYKNTKEILTTLAGGKIRIRKGISAKDLLPNEQSKTELESNTIEIYPVDASKEIAWVKGLFNFDEEPLSEIMETLSRWYNVEVFFNSPKLKSIKFSGVLERTNSIEDILKLFETTSGGEVAFKTKNNVVIIE
ncbi:FecR family protein [Flagellimonas maritima]|nr:FecR family protein [Allomuricauda aurantiaca]